MKCHYEVLGVERDVGDDEIKRAYRKLALKWHPDKNMENPEIAKEQFQLIQQAYDVLSDSHERAWYDNHREAILKGGVGENYKDDTIDVFRYFTTTCYRSYNDDEKGFYTVYRRLFENIAEEDSEFTKNSDTDEEPPNFGDSGTPYEDVHNFYAHWQSYTTKRSYAWLEPYDTRETPNRRISRLAEKENKKIRDRAKRERNEQIRNLVAFVRKRDKRVQANAEKLAEKARANALKAQERKRNKIIERQEELKNHRVSEWTKFDNVESELKNIEANLAEEFGERANDDNSDNDNDALYCVACNKIFKTRKAFANHENSRKHRENFSNLQSALEIEESAKISDDDIISDDAESNESSSSVNEKSEDEAVTLEKNSRSGGKSGFKVKERKGAKDGESTGEKNSMADDEELATLKKDSRSDGKSNFKVKGKKSTKGGESTMKNFKVTGDDEESTKNSADGSFKVTTKNSRVFEENVVPDENAGATGPQMEDFLFEPVRNVIDEENETSNEELYSDDDEDEDETMENNFHGNKLDFEVKYDKMTVKDNIKVREVIENEETGIESFEDKNERVTLNDNIKLTDNDEKSNDLYVYPQGSKVKDDGNFVDTSSDELLSDQEDETEQFSERKKKKKSKVIRKVTVEVASDDENFNDDLGLSKKQRRKRRNFEESIGRKESTNDLEENDPVTRDENQEIVDNVETNVGRTKGKRAKDNRKAVKQREKLENVKTSRASKRETKNDDINEADHRCVKCKTEFSSKNKLFDHLKKTGHSVYLPNVPGKTKKNNVKKTRGRAPSESDSS